MSTTTNPEYLSYLIALRQIANYAVDLSQTEQRQSPSAIPFQITREEFFEHLYQPRSTEAAERDAFLNARELLILAGPRGSGKTCLGLKLKQQLESDPVFKSFVSFIDLRIEGAELFKYLDDMEEFQRELEARIENDYESRLFAFAINKHDGITRNFAIELWSYLIAADRPINIFRDLVRVQTRVRALFSQQGGELERLDRGSIYEWMSSEYPKNGELVDLVEQLKTKINLAHLVYAAREIYNFERQYIWLDNVDRLPQILQSRSQVLINLAYSRIVDHATVIVALRDENMLREVDLEEPGAPPHTYRVKFDAADENGFHPLDISRIELSELARIIRKRLEFTRVVHSNQHVFYKRQIEREKDALALAISSQEKSLLISKIERLQHVLDMLGPPISDKKYSDVVRISDKLLRSFAKLHAICLANGSVRYLLQIHSDCLSYLFSRSLEGGDGSIEEPDVLQFEDWYISTLFLSWVRNTSNTEHRIGIYDIIKQTDAWFSSEKKQAGCVLEYLLITTTWNQTLFNQIGGGKNYRKPTVAAVIEALNLLGYDRGDILETFYVLYQGSGGRSSIIDIQGNNPGVIKSSSDIEDHFLVNVMPRGKCIVGTIGNTFGYLYECYRQLKPADTDFLELARHPNIAETDKVIDELLPVLCDIAHMHIATLQDFRDSRALGGEDWLRQYYANFGCPVFGNYSPSSIKSDSTGGERVDGVRRMLQFEMIIRGIIAYMPSKYEKQLDNLTRLKTLYDESLQALAEMKEPFLDFRTRMELPERSMDGTKSNGERELEARRDTDG